MPVHDWSRVAFAEVARRGVLMNLERSTVASSHLSGFGPDQTLEHFYEFLTFRTTATTVDAGKRGKL